MKREKQLKQKTTPAAASGTKLNFIPLDKNSFTPMYFQIKTQLLKMIQSGQLHAGDTLPSETELSRIYSVSRMTSRQALQTLKNQGYISRHKGTGSFVSQPRVEKDIAHLCGFTAEMRALGLHATSQILEAGVSPASAEVASTLGVAVNAPIFHMLRIRLADKLPIAIEEIRLPYERFHGVEKLNFSRLSLYQTLREQYGIRMSRADEILEARVATHREADLLEIKARSSVLVISRTLWSTDGLPVEAGHSIYRGDRYRAVLRIPATVME
jgi:GntR family transcriptional regulator